MSKPILCVDFDGVIHSYASGWQGPLVIADHVTPGFFEWVDAAAQHFDVQVYSSRSREQGATEAMLAWLVRERRLWREAGGKSPIEFGGAVPISFPDQKPAAFLTIDDRAVLFRGRWDSPELEPAALLAFRPWNKP